MLRNNTTTQLLDAFVENPTSTLLVIGSEHSGIEEVISDTTNRLLGMSAKNNIVMTEPVASKSLGVEKIRELKKSLTTSAKQKNNTRVGRVAIVKHADRMTTEAQNSILKLIEEPVHSTILILQTKDASALLETVRSRCQVIKLLPLTEQQMSEHAQKVSANQQLTAKSRLLSGGDAKLFETLIAEEDSDMLADIDKAKQFLVKPVFDRLTMQKEYAQADILKNLLEALRRVAEAAMHGAQPKSVARWQKTLEQILECQRLSKLQTPPKLIFLKLCVNI